MIKIGDENLLVALKDGGEASFDGDAVEKRLTLALREAGEEEWLASQLVLCLEEAIRRRNASGNHVRLEEIDGMLVDILLSAGCGAAAENFSGDVAAEASKEKKEVVANVERRTRYISSEEWGERLRKAGFETESIGTPLPTSDLLPVVRLRLNLDGWSEMNLPALEHLLKNAAAILQEMCDCLRQEWDNAPAKPERRLIAVGIENWAAAMKITVRAARIQLKRLVEAVDPRIDVIGE